MREWTVVFKPKRNFMDAIDIKVTLYARNIKEAIDFAPALVNGEKSDYEIIEVTSFDH